LKDAKDIADEVCHLLGKHFEKMTVCGSIRRKKPEVNDIDIVAIPKNKYNFGDPTLSDNIRALDPEGFRLAQNRKAGNDRFLDGPAIKRFYYKGIMVDLYLANEKTYEVLVLIRTGSAAHNVRLTTLAKGKGWKLKAGGEGLVRVEGEGKNEKIVEDIDSTENGILLKLLGRVPLPEERN
jgi:DNA polymerase/3'-5' exonuclease PolX